MNVLRTFIGFLGLASALAAQSVTVSLVPPAASVAAGSEAEIELVALNRSATEHVFIAPTALLAELTLGAQSHRVELRAVASADQKSDRLAPGAFTAQRYTFAVPAGAQGQAILETTLAGFSPLRGVLDVQAAATAASDTPAQVASARPEHVDKPTTNLVRAEPAASVIQRTFVNRLAPHEPVYFIYGSDGPAAKFQFSFKYKMLEFSDVDRDSMARTLQFAFTQRSLWDIDGESSPFYDTSYMPEVIYESLAPKPEERDTWFTWLGYQAGFRHESNGRDGPVSRSLNVVYARPVFAFGMLDGWHLLVVPEFYTYVDTLEDNRDLKDYRGYGKLSLVFGRNDGPSLMATMWAGKDFKHRTIQLDLTYPIRTKLLNFETYFLVQYFNGYGESLLSYSEKSETVRAGISLVR
jgi:outer membrane phospholipase A